MSIFRDIDKGALYLIVVRETDYSEYKSAGEGLASFARVLDDGRIVISLDLKQKLPDLPKDYAQPVQEFALDDKTWSDVPRLNIVVMIVGSRGE